MHVCVCVQAELNFLGGMAKSFHFEVVLSCFLTHKDLNLYPA